MRTTTDFTTLGRLGTAGDTLSGGTLRRRMRMSGPRIVRRTTPAASRSRLQVALAVVGGLLVLLFLLGTTAQSQMGAATPAVATSPALDPGLAQSLLEGGTRMAATGARTLIPGGGAAVGVVEVPPAFAGFEDLALTLPTRAEADVVFGEADVIDWLPLAPIGTLTTNDNPDGFEPPAPFAGPDYAVAAPATGIRPATGLARVRVPAGSDVISPVTGTVVAVEQYSTADGDRDWRIVIEPATRPDVQVVLRRVGAPLVSVGQQVGVGQDSLGNARPAPPGEDRTSVWIGVRPAITTEVADPNRPAVATTAPTD